MRPSLEIATDADAAAIVALRNAVAADLSRRHGHGHWSSETSVNSVLRGIKTSRVLVARTGGGSDIVATLRLATKKPWAIDKKYFVDVARPLYLLDMAVEPTMQRQGIGRRLLEETNAIGKSLRGDAIRLDAYDHAAGAGAFYARCGYREVGRVTYRGTPLIYFERML